MTALYDILLWFYCLPVYVIVAIGILASTIFVLLRKRYGYTVLWYLLVATGMIASFVLICLQTIFGRTAADTRLIPELIPLHTYRAVLNGGNPEILRMNFMNTVLLYPAGLFFCEILPKKWPGWLRILLVTLTLCALCAGIEYCQYYFAFGQAEIDDVLHNTLGALMGALVYVLSFRKIK